MKNIHMVVLRLSVPFLVELEFGNFGFLTAEKTGEPRKMFSKQ